MPVVQRADRCSRRGPNSRGRTVGPSYTTNCKHRRNHKAGGGMFEQQVMQALKELGQEQDSASAYEVMCRMREKGTLPEFADVMDVRDVLEANCRKLQEGLNL